MDRDSRETISRGIFAPHGTHALALDDVIAAGTKHHFLQPQSQHNHDDQQNGQGRAFTDALERAAGAGNELVDPGGQGVDLLAEAQNGGHAEVGQRAGQDQQRARAGGRQHQRHGDPPDDVPLLGARDTGGFFQRGIHALQRGNHLHEYEGEVIGAFHKNNAADGIDVEGRLAQMEGSHQPFVQVAGAGGQEQLPRHGPEEGREHIGNGEHGPHQALQGNIAAAQKPCKEQAYHGAEQRHQQGDLDGVPHGRHVGGIHDNFGKETGVELALKEEGVVDDHHHGDDHHNNQNHEGQNGQHFIQAELFSIHARHVAVYTILAANHACASSS